MAEGPSPDKQALLAGLKIDRDAGPGPRRPLKWLLGLAAVGGVALITLTLGVPALGQPEVAVATTTARAASGAAGGSVLDATGYVVARRQATVSSKTTGKVLEVLVEEGMAVAAGQVLAVLDDSIPRAQLALAEAQVAAARASLGEIEVGIQEAELDLRRSRDMAERNLASQAEHDRARLALEALRARLARTGRDIEVAERNLAVQRQLLSDFEIRAPFGGIVIAKAAQPGEMISPVSAGGGFTRTGICTIVDMDSLEVEVDVNEAYINRVEPGQPVTARLNAYPKLELPAAVIATIPAADRNKATVRVRIRFLGSDPRILPDMGVKVAFLDSTTAVRPESQAVIVPAGALFEERGASHVWVVRDGAATHREVQVLKRAPDGVYISAGLAAGERVVRSLSEAQRAQLRDGARIAAAD